MKISNLARFFALGFLAALLLAGCSNPITGLSPASGEPPAELRADPLDEPFTVDIRIGTGSSARTVAGPSSDRIKAGLRNFIQLIVVDDQGNLAALVEDRRENAGDADWTLAIESLDFRKTYSFLLLMGYWKHNGNYVYDDNEPPTLLAAGFKEQAVEGSGTISVVMWPLVVDTVFTTTNEGVPVGSRTIAPVISNGVPQAAGLLPVDWGVTWTVKKGAGSGNGFEYLVQAQKKVYAEAGEELLVKSKQTILRAGHNETAPITPNTATGNGITASLGSYTAGITNIGVRGSVQFKLEYVPFNLTGGGAWAAYNEESKFTLDGETPPVWIIRNGVNDKAQDSETDFTKFKDGNTTENGNGAVAFVVAADTADPVHPQTGDLKIKDEAFVGPSSSDRPKIKFTTEGYAGTAEAYYAVVPGGASGPEYSAYTKSLGSFAVGKDHQGTVELATGNGNYDVYVVLFKDGKVSAPVKINTAAGGQAIEYEWGGRFVAVSADDSAIWSEDGGETWTEAALPGSYYWDNVVYGDGVFIATGGYQSNVRQGAKSIDGGQTWEEMILPTTGRVKVGYGDGVFVALGRTTNQAAARSEDGGETWEEVTLPVSGDWKRVAYGNGVFITADFNDGSNTAIRSEDGGKTWTEVTLPVSTKWAEVSYGNDVFVAVGDNAAAKSEDGGKTWTEVTPLSSPDYYWSSVAYGNGVFVAIDYGKDTNGSDKAVWSVDGETWTDAVLPSSTQWVKVAYGGGMFVAIDLNNSGAARSEDGGRTWMAITPLPDGIWPFITFGECP